MSDDEPTLDPAIELRAKGPARYRRLVDDDHEAVAIGVQHDDVQVDAGVELDNVGVLLTFIDVHREGATISTSDLLEFLEGHVDAPGNYQLVDRDEWEVTLSGRTEAWRQLAVALAETKSRARRSRLKRIELACDVLESLETWAIDEAPAFARLDLLAEHAAVVDEDRRDRELSKLAGTLGEDGDRDE
jgi:hypothetical protein